MARSKATGSRTGQGWLLLSRSSRVTSRMEPNDPAHPRDFSTWLVEWSPVGITGNALPPRDPNDDEDDDEDEEEEDEEDEEYEDEEPAVVREPDDDE